MNLISDILKDTELTIKTMNASLRSRNSDKRFEAIKAYSNKLQVYLIPNKNFNNSFMFHKYVLL